VPRKKNNKKMVLEKISIVAALAIGFGVICLIIWNVNVRERYSENWETFTSMLHLQVLKCIEANSISDPYLALLKISEAASCVALLSKLAGGDAELTKVSNIDVSRLINTMTFQERQIRKHLEPRHPVLDQLSSESS
jgi:hypothetical protein